MNYFEALYGGMYYSILKKEGNTNSARFTGNLVLSCFMVLLLVLLMLIGVNFSDSFERDLVRFFGKSSGKGLGKIITLPILFLIYFIISISVGREKNYEKYIDKFIMREVNERDKALKIVSKPFYIIIGLFFILLLLSFFK